MLLAVRLCVDSGIEGTLYLKPPFQPMERDRKTPENGSFLPEKQRPRGSNSLCGGWFTRDMFWIFTLCHPGGVDMGSLRVIDDPL